MPISAIDCGGAASQSKENRQTDRQSGRRTDRRTEKKPTKKESKNELSEVSFLIFSFFLALFRWLEAIIIKTVTETGCNAHEQSTRKQ